MMYKELNNKIVLLPLKKIQGEKMTYSDKHISVREAKDLLPDGYSLRDISHPSGGMDTYGYDFGIFNNTNNTLIMKSFTAFDESSGDPRWGGRSLSVFDREAFTSFIQEIPASACMSPGL